MKKILKFTFFLFLITLTSCHNYIQQTNIVNKKNIQFPTKSFTKIYKILKVDSCKTNENCKVGRFATHGSGISIGKMGNDSIILTAGHVCEMQLAPSFIQSVGKYNVQMIVQNLEGIHKDAIIVHSVHDDKRDLCMLLAKNLDTKGVKLSWKSPKTGDIVYSMAAPAGIFHPPVVPLIDGIFNGDITRYNSLITMDITYGASGSGVLNYDMELVGILFATHPAYKASTLTSTHQSLMLFVNEAFEKLRSIER